MPDAEVQELLLDAWDAEEPARRVALAREALARDPGAIDGYVILAHHAGEPAEQIALLRIAVAAGRRRWAESARRPTGHPFWLDPETQPFMRAVYDLAIVLWDNGERAEAAGLLDFLLELNADDHQGARYLALSWRAALADWAAVERLLERYEEDQGTDFLYALALDGFRRGVDAEDRLDAAIDANPHVPAFLLDPATLPPDDLVDVEWGSPEEAAGYAGHARGAWQAVPGALDWLADVWEEIGGPEMIADLDREAGRPEPLYLGPKIGRNAPCPCGSGKKYKHCCGAL